MFTYFPRSIDSSDKPPVLTKTSRKRNLARVRISLIGNGIKKENILWTLAESREWSVEEINGRTKTRVGSFFLRVYFLGTFYPIVSPSPSPSPRDIIGPNPAVETKGCIGQVRRSERGQNITPTESGGALPPREDASRRVPAAYLFLHLNFIILFRRYGAPVRFLRSYIHDTDPSPRRTLLRAPSTSRRYSSFRGQFCGRSGALIRTR